MNRYKQQLDEMDARHQWRVRVFTFAGAATLIVLALWASGASPGKWIASIDAWFFSDSQEPQKTATATNVPQPSAKPTPPVATVPAGTDSSISKTPLPLYLISTSPGRSPKQGTARLGTNTENPQTFVAGAVLLNGAKLAEIHRDHVVLERGAQRFNLYTNAADKRNRDTAKALKNSDLAVVGGETRKSAPAPTLRSDLLAEVIRPSALYEQDRLVGLQVFPGAKLGVFSQLGLQSGDVITAIDGAPITDARVASELLEQLKSGVVMTVAVRRAGKISTVSLDGNAVLKAFEKPPHMDALGPPSNG